MSKEKIKLIFEHSTYNQHIGFLYVSFILLILLFFKADKLIGAIGLRQFYAIGSMTAAIGVAIVTLIILGYWRSIYPIVSIALVVLVVGLAAILNISLLVFGWIVTIVTFEWLGFWHYVFVLLFIGNIMYWLVIWRRSLSISQDTMSGIVIVLAILTSAYLLGTSSIAFKTTVSDDIHIENQHYFLWGQWGWYRDPDYLVLYECNSIGILCKEAYSRHDDYYLEYNPTLHLVNDTIQIRLEDGTIVHEYQRKP